MDKNRRTNVIIGACLVDCVHVAGILNFFQVMELHGFKTHFLGPATPIDKIIEAIKNAPAGADVAISYRLTPENGILHVKKFIEEVKKEGLLDDHRYFLGCLPGLEKLARDLGFFEKIFVGGETINEILPYFNISSRSSRSGTRIAPGNLLERIEEKKPFPIIRAHFGLPSIAETTRGIEVIAESGLVDVISIAPDQAAQEWLQRPDVLSKKVPGAGGVPIRSKEHLLAFHEARLRGNYPLLRIYSGTQDLVENAKLFVETIDNAWAAIPIFWYSELDGRGPTKLLPAIKEHFRAIRWHAERNIPVEINDPHQWGLRMAPDHLVVADAFLSARVAKSLGVSTFVQQLMFNTPAGNTFKMDLARVLAMIEIVQPLVDESFKVLKETRAGLAYLSPREPVAMGQLCASTLVQMSVAPHIVHVVTHCEGDHAATPGDIIHSCSMVSRVIQDGLIGLPDLARDPKVIERKNELLKEAMVLLSGIHAIGEKMDVDDPFASPEVLHEAVRLGVMDAPQLVGNPVARGTIKVRIVDGKAICVDDEGKPVPEVERLRALGIQVDDGIVAGRRINDLFYQPVEQRGVLQGP